MRFILVSLVICLALNSCGDTDTTVVSPRSVPGDGGSATEKKMVALMRGHPKQKRSILIYNPVLTSVARQRARDMAQRNYFGHVDPDGYGPNWHVTRAGYRLPLEWTAFKNSNQVESILAGLREPEAAFYDLMTSSGHRSHLLATSPFYANHLCYGVGYAYNPNSTYKHYWSIITAPIEK